MEDISKKTDQELFKAIEKNCHLSQKEFKKRYVPLIRYFYNLKFPDTEGFLNYDRGQLFEDIEMSVWLKFFQFCNNVELQFDEEGSIVRVVRWCTKNVINQKIRDAIDNRSHLTYKERMSSPTDECISMTHGDFGVYDNVEAFDYGEDDIFELLGSSEELIKKAQNMFTQEEQAIYCFKVKGYKPEHIKKEMNLTDYQFRAHREKMERKIESLYLIETSSS